MNYIIYFVGVATISYCFSYAMESYNSDIDWRLAFNNELCHMHHEQWCTALVDIHSAAKCHKKYDILGLFSLPTRDINFIAILEDVQKKCQDLHIPLIDNSTQNIHIFLLWLLDAVTRTHAYYSIDKNNLYRLILGISIHKPNFGTRNKDTRVNIAQCIGRIVRKKVRSKLLYIVLHGKMPA